MKKAVLLMMPVWLMALSNAEVAKEADSALGGYGGSLSKVTMTLVNADGGASVRELGIKSIETKEGEKSIITFFKPSDIKGTRLLTHTRSDEPDRQWIYMPMLKRVKRIAGSNTSGSFVGSEFSYEDLAAFDYKKYRYSGDAVKTVYEEVPCFLAEFVPNNLESGYRRQRVWVEQERFLVRKIDYFDRTDALMKTAYFSDYKHIGNVWRVGKIRMLNHHSKKATLLEWTQDEVGVAFEHGMFNKENLNRQAR